jgi:predicted amidohydrolase
MTELSIAVAQPRCVAHDVAANASAHARAIEVAQARVIVFPELSLTGYELDAETIAEDDPRLAPIIAACARTGTLALVGAPVPGPHIGILAVDGTGTRVVYAKVHLHDTEAIRFRPGRHAVIEVDGWRLGLAVCRDTGFPEHARTTAALPPGNGWPDTHAHDHDPSPRDGDGADGIGGGSSISVRSGIDGYVAGVVHADHEAELHGERARRAAADLGVWVATAAFAGPAGGGFDRTSGRSGIWSVDGELLAEASTSPDDFARAVFPAPRERL